MTGNHVRHRVLCLALGLLGLCVLPAASAAPAAKVFAVSRSIYATPALVAQAVGYFAQEGLPLTVRPCTTGQMCLKQVIDGEAQFATVADAPVAVASFEHRHFAVVAMMTRSGSELRILARKDRGLRSLADLRGHRVGAIMGTSGHYFLDTALRSAGIGPAEFTMTALDPNDPVSTLVRGEADAAALFEPLLSQARHQLGDQVVELPPLRFFRMGFNVVAAPPAQASDADVERLLRALARATAFIEAQPAQAQAIVAAAIGLGAGEVAAAWPHYRFGLGLEQGLVNSLEGHARWARRSGLVPAGAAMPNPLQFIRSAPLRAVDPDAVRLVQ